MAVIDPEIQAEMRRLKGRTQFKPFRILTKSGAKYVVTESTQYACNEVLVAYASREEDRIIEIRADDFAGIEYVDQKPAA